MALIDVGATQNLNAVPILEEDEGGRETPHLPHMPVGSLLVLRGLTAMPTYLADVYRCAHLEPGHVPYGGIDNCTVQGVAAWCSSGLSG